MFILIKDEGNMKAVEVISEYLNPVEIAEGAGLRYVRDTIPGYSRKRDGEKYRYFNQYGELIESERTIIRINKLVIPHIWNDVWICPLEKGHLQATGIDTKYRKQYRYHKEWEKVRSETKFSKMFLFGTHLRAIRETVKRHLEIKTLTKEKVLATLITLLDEKLIRIGNKEYERKYKTYGLTTLKDKHVKNLGNKVVIQFVGKKNIEKEVIITDKKLASIIKKCKELPGYDLFQYWDDDGILQKVTSEDVNSYLKEITGESFTAKDFRTLGGSCIALKGLLNCPPCETEKEIKKNIVEVIKKVSSYLGNSPNVCKSYYIHPQIFEKYSSQEILTQIQEFKKHQSFSHDLLSEEENVFMNLLNKRNLKS